MYILIISRGYPSDKYPTHGIFEFDQAKALVEAGCKVIYAVVDVRSVRRWRKWGFESFYKNGVQIEAINIPCGRIPKKMLNKIKQFALKMLYKKIHEKYGQPDIIHAHFIGSGYLIAQLFSNSQIPLVLTEHYSAMNQSKIDPYFERLGHYTYPRMDKVIAVSSYLAKNIKEKFTIEPIVIPNIVDLTNFKYTSEKKDMDIFNFVSTGNLQSNKRMGLLIEAFYKAFNGNKKIRLYIFGDGPERAKLEKMIIKYGMKEQIFLMGLVDRKVIASKMKESHCFILASKHETFGVAYIEAMAMGLPVIATKCGGPEDFITEDNGILIPVDDVNALVQAMKWMYENIEKYDRKDISKDIIEKFSPGAISRKIINVYKDVKGNS